MEQGHSWDPNHRLLAAVQRRGNIGLSAARGNAHQLIRLAMASRISWCALPLAADRPMFPRRCTAASRRWFGSHEWPCSIVSLIHLAYRIARDDIILAR